VSGKKREIARRDLIVSSAVAGGAILLGRLGTARGAIDQSLRPDDVGDGQRSRPSAATGQYTPVVVPDGTTLRSKLVNGVKVYHLIADQVEHEFAPGLRAACWGYNGSVHGPLIEAVEGDRLRIYVSNRLPEPTSMHCHGVFMPSGMDGVGGLSQRPIPPGETFKYEFTLQQHGTFMYHPHHDEMTQIALGMTGMFVVHPRQATRPPADRDFAIMLHEWRIDVGTRRPNPNEMSDFNVLTMNGRAFPGTAPLVAKAGERVRIRFGNLGPMDHHPVHLHGHAFRIVETDGGAIPESAQWPETTVLVPAGSTRTIEFVAKPGDWALHCHMTHHAMNQMGHGFPNMIGMDGAEVDRRMRSIMPGLMIMGQSGMGDMQDANMPVPENSIPMVGGHGPYGAITMGGMFTILKVREQLASYEDPGWYDPPLGTVAVRASDAELRADGIDVS